MSRDFVKHQKKVLRQVAEDGKLSYDEFIRRFDQHVTDNLKAERAVIEQRPEFQKLKALAEGRPRPVYVKPGGSNGG